MLSSVNADGPSSRRIVAPCSVFGARCRKPPDALSQTLLFGPSPKLICVNLNTSPSMA